MVYVDDMDAAFGRMVMCHMVADTTDELLAMADQIGVQRKWIQYAGTKKEHFDICLSKKRKAIALGARAITWLELGAMLSKRRHQNERLVYRSEDVLRNLKRSGGGR